MGQRQPFGLERKLVVGDEIDVDDPRPPSLRRRAAELDLQRLDAFEQRLRLEARPAESAGVDEPVLVGLAPGRRAVEAGDRGQFDLRLARNRAQRPAQACDLVADVAAEREDDARFSIVFGFRRGRERGGALERHEDGERRAVFDHVMHAQHRRPSHERDRVGGERAGETPIDLGVNDAADERLAREPDQDRRAKATEAIEIPDAGMVLLPRLAEADARIEQDPAKGHASAGSEVERALEEALDVIEDVDRRIRLLAVVHDDDRRAGLRDGVRHAGIALQSPDVVDDASAEPRRLARDRRLAGVDGDRRVKVSQRLEHRNHSPGALRLQEPEVTGPCRFAANVDDRRPVGDHRFGARDGCGEVGMATAVGEGIRRHVENAHELGRVFQRAEERVAMDDAAVNAHQGRLSPLRGFRNLLPNPRREIKRN